MAIKYSMNVCVVWQDEYNNTSGSSLNGKVHLEVINSCHVDEVPVLVGNTTRIQLALLHGRVTVQVCYLCRVSTTLGNPGNLLEFKNPPGNPGNLLEFNGPPGNFCVR